jgi:hypothetical protein
MKCLSLGICLACTLLVSRLGFGVEVTPAAGTRVSITLAEPIDSDHEVFGKQYQAFLTAPVALPDGKTVSAGARATVSLIHNNSGWLTQLTSIVVNGRTFAVSSSAGSIIVPGQQNKPDSSSDLLIRIGLGRGSTPSTGRIQLGSSTQLRFRLIGIATPARQPAENARRRPASPAEYSPAVSSPQPAGISYLCRATDESGHAPNPYYVADVQKTRDEPALVETSWRQYLVATYPYRFANNPHAVVQCTRLMDAAGERDSRRTVGESVNSNPDDPRTIHTPWRYTLGLPAAPSAK